MPGQKCPACRGTGKCRTCRGKGFLSHRADEEEERCLDCGGSGICEACDGTGTLPLDDHKT